MPLRPEYTPPAAHTPRKGCSRHAITDLTGQKHVYPDSFRIYFTKDTPKDLIAEARLAPMCGRAEPLRPMQKQPSWSRGLHIHQATLDLMAYLYREVHERDLPYLVNQVHLKLEVETPTFVDAEVVGNYYNRRIIKSHLTNARRKVRRSGEGVYIGPYVLYYDDPGKASGNPCYAIEWKADSTQAVRGLGIDPYAALVDLVTFDHVKFWAATLRLAEPDLRALGRGALGRSKVRTDKLHLKESGTWVVRDWEQYVGNRYLLAHPLTQDLIINLKDAHWFKPKTMLRVLDGPERKALLPTANVPGFMPVSQLPFCRELHERRALRMHKRRHPGKYRHSDPSRWD